MTDAVRELFIKKYYNGDAEAYDKMMHSDDPEADARYLAYGIDPCTHWSDIELHTKCHPEYEELALAWVRYALGYLPQEQAYMPYLAVLQTLVENDRTGKLPEGQFVDELLFYVKRIRNNDMKKGGWVYHTVQPESVLKTYETHLSLYKQQARERLCKFLGYEPLLEYSCDAEVFLRQIFENDAFYSDMPWCDADYKAGNIASYRQIFLKDGEAAADASEFILRRDLDPRIFDD